MLIRLRHWNPDVYSLSSSGDMLHGDVVGEMKAPYPRTEFLAIRTVWGSPQVCGKKQQQQRRDFRPHEDPSSAGGYRLRFYQQPGRPRAHRTICEGRRPARSLHSTRSERQYKPAETTKAL